MFTQLIAISYTSNWQEFRLVGGWPTLTKFFFVNELDQQVRNLVKILRQIIPTIEVL